MAEVEKVHFLTDAIHKNLLDNFYPGIKQLVSTGRAFQKSLHAVVASSKAYVDCIYGIARGAQVCKGATSEIGAALLQIAEVHKEINTQVLDNIKMFHSELLIPLESSQENELKQMQTLHKKYLAGHKFHLTPLEKAQMSLKKQKKKNKNKFGFDQKELQYSREVKECVIKLEEYHSHQLREALLEERKMYCGLLDKICTVVRNYASHHSKAHELLTHRLSEWSELCDNPHILPESSELVVQAFRNAHQDDMYSTTDEMQDMRRRASLEYARPGSNSGSNPGSNQDSDSLTYGTAHRLQGHDPFHSPLANGILTTQDDYAAAGHLMTKPAVAGLQRSITFHDSPGPRGRHKVRAIYSHQANGDNQLSFTDSDVISLLGEQRDGWQYGENMRTHRMGWFPLSFTQPLQTGSADAHVSVIPSLSLSGRVKSLGNLREVNDEDYHHQPAQPINSGYSDSDSGHGVDIGKRDRPGSLYQHTSNNKPKVRLRDKRVSWCGEGWNPSSNQRPQSLLCEAETINTATTTSNGGIGVLPPPPVLQEDGRVPPLRLPRLGIKSCLIRVPEHFEVAIPPPEEFQDRLLQQPTSNQSVTDHTREERGHDSSLSVNNHNAQRDTASPPLPPPPPPHPNHMPPHPRDTSPNMPPPPPPLNNPHAQHHHSHTHLQHNLHNNHHHPPVGKLMHANTTPHIPTNGLQPPTPMYEYHPRMNNNNSSQPPTSATPTGEYASQNQLNNHHYSPANSSSGYSSNASASGYVTSNINSGGGNYGGRTASYPADKFPPPPSNMPPLPPPASGGENERGVQRNAFSNVSLKRTKTNDRSAPRV